MKQTNVTYPALSEKFLQRFEEISTKDNIESIKPLSTSIRIRCICGCTHVMNFVFSPARTPQHYQKHFVELCQEHSFTIKEINTLKKEIV